MDVNFVILLLRLTFLYLYIKEVIPAKFRRKKDKWIWFFIVLVFGFYGYSTYLVYRRTFIIKRKFDPDFNLKYISINTENQ